MSGIDFADSPPRLDPALLFKALSEELRLRILGVLDVAEFSVAELTEALGAPQSTISRHLGRLREAELVTARRQGTLVFYSKGPALENGVSPFLAQALEALPHTEPDRAAGHRLLERRRRASQSYFDAVARKYREIAEPGGSWQALAGALALGFDGKTVADIGAGEGELATRLAESAERVYAIDHSKEMVRLLKEKARRRPNLTALEGDFEELPLENASVDVAIASQILHHCPLPRRALDEAWRVIAPGGRLILIDLAEHEAEWAREKLADHWLGFDEAELAKWMEAAGFVDVKRFACPALGGELQAITLTGRKG